jgi:hypothetical protein
MMQINIDASQIKGAEEAFRLFPERLRAHMKKAMQFSLEEVLKHALDLVHVRTGTLRRSINMSQPIEAGSGFDGKVGTNLVYGPMEEFGFAGTQKVRSFTRSGAFGRPTKPYTVSAFTRQVNRPEHPYLRPALARATDAIRAHHEKAVEDTAAEMNV